MATVADKRIIVRHGRGPRAGLREIAGLLSDLQQHFHQPGVPAFLPTVQLGDQTTDLELERVEDSYVLYRELVPTPSKDDAA